MQYEETLRASRKACEDQLKKQETEFLQTLEEVTAAYRTYKVTTLPPASAC